MPSSISTGGSCGSAARRAVSCGSRLTVDSQMVSVRRTISSSATAFIGSYAPALDESRDAIASGKIVLGPLELVAQVHRRLRRSEEEIPIVPEHLPDPAEDLLLGVDVEVDHDVAHEDEIERRKGWPALDQVDLLEVDAI